MEYRKHILHIDSRDRNYDTFPSPNAYRLMLPSKYRHVVSARLLGCELPSSFFVFSASLGNTSLAVTDHAGTSHTVTIPDGNYSQTSLPLALADAFGGALGETVTVSLDSVNLQLTLAATNDFSIDTRLTAAGVNSQPAEWGLGYFLGLRKGEVTATSGGIVTLPGVVSLNPYTYILLDVSELNNVDTGGLFGSEVGGKTFAKVPLSTSSFEYNFTGKDALYQMHLGLCEYRPPIQKLDRLSVRFLFHDGRIVNFNGIEHSFSIELTCRVESAAQSLQTKPRLVPPPPPPPPPPQPAVHFAPTYNSYAADTPAPKFKFSWWILGFVAAVIAVAVYSPK